MAFPEKFKQSLEDLQATVDRKLAQIDALDKSLQEVGQQYVRRCSQEIKEMMQRIRAGHTMPGFSYAALAEQRWSLRISDAKVALAIGLSEIVDKHIKQLDQYIEEIEARRHERELSATCSTSSSCTLNTDTPTRSERFQRKARSRQTRAHLALERPSVADVEMPIYQNERTYCICHEISYGNMICCDNDNCKIEWFHFECVGLKNAPKGKWYCPDCAPFQKDCK